MFEQRGQAGADGQFVLNSALFGAQGRDVLFREGDVAAFQWLTAARGRLFAAGGVTLLVAHRLVRVEDTHRERARIDRGVSASHQPLDLVIVGDDSSAELASPFLESKLRCVGGWSSQAAVFVTLDHLG